MRQITRKIAEAFHNRQALKIDNTHTDGTSLWLLGNMIAQWGLRGLYISTAGYNTPTTRERLNGLLGVGINSSRGKLLLNGHPWDGGWVNVDEHNEIHEGVPFVDSPPTISDDQKNRIESARAVLEEAGYFTRNLWHIDDVKGKFKCTDDEAHKVLYDAMTNYATREQIWLAIEVSVESKSLTEIDL